MLSSPLDENLRFAGYKSSLSPFRKNTVYVKDEKRTCGLEGCTCQKVSTASYVIIQRPFRSPYTQISLLRSLLLPIIQPPNAPYLAFKPFTFAAATRFIVRAY